MFLRYIELDEAAAAKEIQKNYRRIKLNKLNQFFEFFETVFLLGCISFISTQETAAKAAVFWVEINEIHPNKKTVSKNSKN